LTVSIMELGHWEVAKTLDYDSSWV
jgi:hypothetical protein